MSTRASSALRAIPARPKVEAEETPDFGRLIEDLRADLYKALEHGQVADVQNALRGQVGENEVVKQIRGTHRPSGAVIAAMLWFVRAGAQARNLESLALLARVSRIKAVSVVVSERARSARLRFERDIKKKRAGVAAPAGKGDHQ